MNGSFPKAIKGNISLRHISLIFLFSLFFSILLIPKVSDTSRALKNMNSLQDSNAKSDVSEREAKSQKGGIQEIVNEVYTANREFFLGVKNIYVSKEDLNFLASPNISGCSANVLGAYYNGTIIIKDSGDNTNRHTLLHELAHNAWKILSEERKSEWENIFLKSSSFVTPYAKYSKEEDFAESFACYFEDYEGCINPIEKEKLDFISDIGSNEMKKS